MKKLIGLIIVISLIFLGQSGVVLFEKIRHAKRLEIGVAKFKLVNLSSKIQSNLVLTIGNFSSSTFSVDQINISAYTTTGQLLAQQIAPLPQSILLQPNQNNLLPLAYRLNTPVLLSELKKIGGVSSVLANYLTKGKYGLPIVLKGFVVSGSIETEIQTSITV